MKLTVGSQLLDVLKLASRIIPRTTIKPILRCVKLEASGDNLIVAAGDLETRLRYRIDCSVEDSGVVIIPLDKLKAIVGGLLPRKKQKEIQRGGFFKRTEETISIETDGNDCYIRKGGGEFKILGYDPAEYPATIEFAGDTSFQVLPKMLEWMISRVLFAIVKGHSHYALSGALWDANGNDLVMAGTDGHRLAEVNGKLVGNVDSPIKVVLRREFMGLLRRLSYGKKPIDFSVEGDHTVFIRSGDVILSSALLQGNFPSYKDLIPRDVSHEATVRVEDIERSVRKAHAMTDEYQRGIKMSFRDGGIDIFGHSVEMGTAEIVCPAEYRGDGITLGFNPVHLFGFLGVVASEYVTFGMNKRSSGTAIDPPVRIRGDEGFTYVIMPVSVV